MNYSAYRKMIEEESKFLDTIPIEKYLEDGIFLKNRSKK